MITTVACSQQRVTQLFNYALKIHRLILIISSITAQQFLLPVHEQLHVSQF